MTLTLFIKVFGAELLRIARTELEDIAHLNGPLGRKRSATTRTQRASLSGSDVRNDVGLVVSPGVGVAQVPADPVRSSHQVRGITHAFVDDDESISHSNR